MKCLSVRQPFADLLALGQKTIELRNWNEKFRGKFLIHASQKINSEAYNRLGIDKKNLIKGKIIETACLYDVKEYQSYEEFNKDEQKHFSKNFGKYKYGFLIKDARKCKNPIPYSGKVRFFEVNDPKIIICT